MPVFGSQWFAAPDTTYEIDQSIRFESGDDARLSRSPSSSGSLTTWTLSCWVKRGRPNANENGQWFPIWSASDGSSTYDAPLYIGDASAPGPWNVSIAGQNWTTTQKAADVAAWYHTVVVWDSTNGTAGDRMRLYINGSRVTDFSATGTVTSSMESRWNSSSYSSHRIGSLNITGGADNKYLFDGYLAEMVFLDGTASTDASDFGETNSDTGQWIPKDVSGLTFGTNGFYVDGRDSSDLGDDESGNGNDWSSTNLAATDQMSDSPTANHCTLNPFWVDGHSLTEGNLVASAAADSAALGTIAFDPTDSDGFYFEAKVTTAATYPNVGIRTIESPAQVGAASSLSGNTTGRYSFTGSDGDFNDAGSSSSYGSSWAGTADKVIGVLVKAGALYFSIDGTIQNSGTAAKTGLTGLMLPTVFYDAGSGTSAAWEMRFAASDWGTTPTGYKAISSNNLADPQVENPSKYFHTQLYTGDGSSGNSITNNAQAGDFKPDLLIIAPRSNGDHHQVFDSVRGTTNRLQTNQADAETTDSTALVTFESDGFDLDTTDVNYNGSSRTYCGWQWSTDGASAATNEDGSRDSSVMVNTTHGFSIVAYTGDGSGSDTYGHGLGATPGLIWVKHRDRAQNWRVFNQGLTGGADRTLFLNSNDAQSTDPDRISAVSSTTFTAAANMNESADYIAYCWAPVPGYSAFGNYEGNSNADGTFIYTGFRPAWITVKTMDSANDWVIYDSKRDPINIADTVLRMDSTNSEYSGSGREIDILSNGFKMRTSNGTINASATFAYMAFSEFPFKYANAR